MTFDVQFFADQNMGSAQEDLRRQVPLRLIAKRAPDDKGLERKLLYPRRHIPAASFALYEESRSLLYSEAHHVSSQVYSARDGALEQF
jgi:fructose-1,6-bisphosphatase